MLDHPNLYVDPTPGFLNNIKDKIQAKSTDLFIVEDTGRGKSTLLKRLKHDLVDQTVVYAVADPRPSLFLQRIIHQLKHSIQYRGTNLDRYKEIISESLSRHPSVFLIDNCGFLSRSTMEVLRELSDDQGELTLVLAGLEEDWDALNTDLTRMLGRRFTRIDLPALDLGGTAEFIVKRELFIKGELDKFDPSNIRSSIFTRGAIEKIHALTGGMPNEVRKAASDSLMVAKTKGLKRITKEEVW